MQPPPRSAVDGRRAISPGNDEVMKREGLSNSGKAAPRAPGRRAAVLLSALALAACATVRTTQPGVVGVEREQSMLVSSATVDREAASSYAEILKQANQKHLLDADEAQLLRVRGIVRRLIPATAAFRTDAPGWRWEVNVLTAKDVNAWCMPGGKIAVYTGLLEQLRPTDDELAAVLAHEIAHALREHGREKAGQALGVNAAAGIGGVLLSMVTGVDPRLGQNLFGAAGDLVFMRPNSREMEQEADRIGVELAARAGYDPRAAASLWQKMERISNDQPPQWLSTHPSHEARVADLSNYAERVMPLYRPGGR